MERIWAPWRIKYILEGYKEKGGCLFCDVIASKDDKQNHVLLRNELSFVMFNLFPYNNGHLMVAPYRHICNFEDLTSTEMAEIDMSIQAMVKIIKKIMKPEGFNIGLNLGKVAGAGFEGHLHYHIVPRWNGDTNFMPVIGDTKVLSESIDATYDRFRAELDAVH
jgi:ATP adenylyltransferase